MEELVGVRGDLVEEEDESDEAAPLAFGFDLDLCGEGDAETHVERRREDVHARDCVRLAHVRGRPEGPLVAQVVVADFEDTRVVQSVEDVAELERWVRLAYRST